MKTSWTLAELADHLGAALEGDPDLSVTGLAGLDEAAPGQVSFLANPAYADRVEHTGATAVLVPEDFAGAAGEAALLRCADPNGAFTGVVDLFLTRAVRPAPGVAPSACLAPDVVLGEDVTIGPGCTLAEGVRLGDRVVLHPGVHLGVGVSIGDDCELHPGVVLYARTSLGRRCLIHGGAVLGSDGFGFDHRDGAWVKVPQAGTVEVDDDVEIGANTTIDRGRFGPTRIGAGCKLDNQVQIAHNVTLGEHVLLASQVGIAGSTRLEPGVIAGGQVGVGGHLRVASGVRLAGGSGVIGSLDTAGDYLGYPARPRGETLRAWASSRAVTRLKKQVAELEARLAEKEGSA